jgi:formylglycine-generating enzyme required for sulfatase activity
MLSKPPDAFLSYTRFDDQHDGGAISEFRLRLANAVRAVTGEPFIIFQDVDGTGLGEYWPGKLDKMLNQARFFIPILTPSYFRSERCREELQKFADYERKAGRNNLIFPIYWRTCRVLEDESLCSCDLLAQLIAGRQGCDWRVLRDRPFRTKEVKLKLESLAKQIDETREMPPRIDDEWTGYVESPLIIPEMVVIQPGEFLMGSPEDDLEAYKDETPPQLVRIGYPLAVGCYPITFDEYDQFVKATGRDPPDDPGWGRGRRPVINVSWRDAKAYVEWLIAETSQPYRLLSEAEWEYTCRAGTRTRYWWGDDFSRGSTGYYPGKIAGPTEVGSYHPNPFGLYDSHGNVWEWVEDVWHDSYFGVPRDGSPWLEGGDRRRVVRGGCWSSEPVDLRAACRLGIDEVEELEIVGFRVARTL